MRRGYGLKPPVYKEYKLTLKGNVPYLAAEAEKLSRTWFLDVLKQAGFSGKANQWNPDAAVPDEIEKLLTDMSFIAQFYAQCADCIRRLPPAANRRPCWPPWSAGIPTWAC